jgi:hypothetical protein
MKKKILLVFVLLLCSSTEVAKADFSFGEPTSLGPMVNSSSEEFNASISSDGLSLYFISNRAGGVGGRDIWVTTRATTEDDWGEPVNLGPTINTPAGEWGVSISYDGLSLYFDTKQSGATGARDDLWVATRTTTDDDWSNPVNLGPIVNSSGDDYTPSISSDNLSLYFTSNRGGGYGQYDIWVTTRETIGDDWGTPVNLGPPVNSSAYELDPGISADGRVLFFVRVDGPTETDIWMARRATIYDGWQEPVNLGEPINSSAWEGYPSISADGSTLFFRTSLSGRRSRGNIWQAPIIPLSVDFNGDGIVDSLDMCMMVEYWHTYEPYYDIAPSPFGDGIVDVQDLVLFSEHLFDDYLAMPHWKLDEEAGNIAQDSLGVHDGTLHGEPLWQPAGGVIDGALLFDGVDDYISTDFILDPSVGAFSVFAWIQGGGPGQIIISQLTGAGNIWLGLDAQSGCLMTGLQPPSTGWVATNNPLVSESIITNEQWHHVGFVWDGSCRALYIDGIEVAKDASVQNPPKSSDGGLYIGADKSLNTGTLFSGMIDDVHIYDIALTAEEIAALIQ